MTSIQICPNCGEAFNASLHKYGGMCSPECRTEYQRAIAKRQPPVPPATWRERPTPNRVHGRDNRS